MGVELGGGRDAVVVGFDVEALEILDVVAGPFRETDHERLSFLFS